MNYKILCLFIIIVFCVIIGASENMENMDTKIILDLSKHGSIPKIIHLSWKNKNIDIDNDKSPMILNGVSNIYKFNKNYKIEISDDNDIENYLKENLNINDYNDIKNTHIVEKVDLWRLLKIYYEGGIYLDFDRYCNKSFDKIINKDVKCVLPTYHDVNFSQDIMISCKNNPIFKNAIDDNIIARKQGKKLYQIGPETYMNSVTKRVFGKKYNEYPGTEVMDNFRKILDKSKYFQTYRESPSNNLFNFKYNEKTFKKGNGIYKDEYYINNDISHWGKDRT